jgi:hypothetical protein
VRIKWDFLRIEVCSPQISPGFETSFKVHSKAGRVPLGNAVRKKPRRRSLGNIADRPVASDSRVSVLLIGRSSQKAKPPWFTGDDAQRRLIEVID